MGQNEKHHLADASNYVTGRVRDVVSGSIKFDIVHQIVAAQESELPVDQNDQAHHG
ncbi:hypothetical protein [Erwinia sp. B116]|uniref:hypothetical protein n=1 Tax=Erwinia sp. B116 TaxID=1561024 RepID=UPI0013041EBC|nr:hypothetical protein [Erwinia sp. B116]